MSQVLVWKSDADGKLFEDKKKYSNHLRKLAAKRREEKKIEQYQSAREQFFTVMGNVANFDELQEFIKSNWDQFRANGASHNQWRKSKANNKDDQLISLALHEVYFKECLSNSHNAPRHGGVQNWDTRAKHNEGKPVGYPGWRCRITYSVTNSSGFGSDYFRDTPINTGSGGGGDKSLSYDVNIWAADFPVMWEKHCRAEWIRKENEQRDYIWRQVGGSGPAVHVTECPEDWVCPDPMQGMFHGRGY